MKERAMEKTRRQFFTVLAGAFAAPLVPGVVPNLLSWSGDRKAFKDFKIAFKWLPPDPMQAVIPLKAIIYHAIGVCKCAWRGTGLWAATGLDEKSIIEADRGEIVRMKMEAEDRVTAMLKHIWDEYERTGMLVHHGCPLVEAQV